MLPRDAGASIINIGSVAGHTAYAGGAAYCAAKAGELQITRALRHELLGTGIRVSTVDPGLAETEFSMVRFKGDTKKAAEIYAGMNPLVAGDIAEILVWVASRPPHVNIDEMIVKPVDQAEVGKVFRRSNILTNCRLIDWHSKKTANRISGSPFDLKLTAEIKFLCWRCI